MQVACMFQARNKRAAGRVSGPKRFELLVLLIERTAVEQGGATLPRKCRRRSHASSLSVLPGYSVSPGARHVAWMRGAALSSNHADQRHHKQRNAGKAPQYRYPANSSIHPVQFLHFTLHYYLTPAAPILLAGMLGWQTAGTPSMRKKAIMGHQLVKPD